MSLNFHCGVTWGLGFFVTIFNMTNDDLTKTWQALQLKVVVGPFLVNWCFPVSAPAVRPHEEGGVK